MAEKKASDFRYNTGETKVPWAAVGENYNAEDVIEVLHFLMQGSGEAYETAMKAVEQDVLALGKVSEPPAKLSVDRKVAEAEDLCDQYLNTKGSTFVTNCTAGFEIAGKYANLQPGDEVIVPAITFIATMAYPLSVGCKLVFADSFGHEPYMLQAAKEFTDVQFCHATGTNAHTEKLANFHNAFASIYEGRYLAGIAAGVKIKDAIDNGKTINGVKVTADNAKVGYVGAFPYAEVISGYTSFFLGIRSVVPTATMEVQYTNSWYDEGKEKEAAEALIGKKCILISQHADSMGAPTACEKANVPNVSYNGSTISACPNTFIVSSRISWTPYFKHIINAVANGTAITEDYCGGIKEGSVVLTDINEKAAAAGTQEAIDAAKAQLEAGTLHVFDTSKFTVDGKTLTTYKADVDTDENYTPDTEAIADGYFHESEYRSAPYFNIIIDGITVPAAN